jgi:hypothetical protein
MIKDNFMKKFISTTLLFWLSSNLTACSFIENKEEKFVNPLFYEKLISISPLYYETKLTPKTIQMTNRTNYSCNLIENTLSQIKFECKENTNFYPNYKTKYFITYTIETCKNREDCLDKDGWIVTQDINSDVYHKNKYLIPSKEKTSNKKFINSVFYKKLYPSLPNEAPILLTPTSITPLGEYAKYTYYNSKKCTMIENNQMFVTLKCEIYDNYLKQIVTKIVRYTLYPCESCSSKWRIFEKNIDGKDNFFFEKQFK